MSPTPTNTQLSHHHNHHGSNESSDSSSSYLKNRHNIDNEHNNPNRHNLSSSSSSNSNNRNINNVDSSNNTIRGNTNTNTYTPLSNSSSCTAGIGGINSGDITLFHRYHYKSLRFSNVFKVFLLVDLIVAICLWLTGGDSTYFVDSVVHFTMETSVFDLAILWLIKTPLYFILVDFTEKFVMKSFDFSISSFHAFPSVLRKRLRALFWKLYLFSLAICIYSIVKGSLVLKEYLRRRNSSTNHSSVMHSTFYACVIWCLISSTITFVLSLASSRLMNGLKDKRVLKYYNRKGQEVDKDGKRVPSEASLLRLVSLAKPEAGLLLVGAGMLIVSSAVQTVAPLFFGKVVDAAIKSMDDLTHTVTILLVIYAVGSVASLFRSWVFNLAGQRLVARLRNKLFASVVRQEVAFFDLNRTGELCNRLSSDTQVLQNAITVNMSMLCRYTLQVVGSLSLMFYLNAALSGVLLAVVPIVSITAVHYGKFVRKMRKKFQDKLADAGTKAEEALSSVRTVKSFSGEMRETEEYEKNIDESYQIGKKLAMAQGFMDGLYSFLAYGAIGAVLFYGGKLVNDNVKDPSTGISSGLLTSFLLYTLQVAMAFALLSSLYGDFMQAVGASVRIFTLLDREPDIFEPDEPLVLPSLKGELEFKNVGFTYPSRPESQVLKNISFKVSPGEMVALVGPSGGGKSTLVSLMERFYDPCEGSITIGGHDLKHFDKRWFHQKVSMVSQEPTLFACSIRDNIAYGRGATDEEVEEAAKHANAHEFITTFEEGYHTMVGERGVRLSGGQKQRVAIARALIMNPTVLLLDEATSALDAESEHLVQEAIDRAMEGRTVIVIAHRLSTVKNAHKVVVINKGEIAEMGTHSELLSKPTVYKSLVMRQLTAGKDIADMEKGRKELVGGHKNKDNDDDDNTPLSGNGNYNHNSNCGTTSSRSKSSGHFDDDNTAILVDGQTVDRADADFAGIDLDNKMHETVDDDEKLIDC